MFKVGDVVRLNRGWTPMIVLHVSAQNEVYAIYACRDWNHITPEHYKNWRNCYSYARHATGFSRWDGEPICLRRNYIMTQRYKSAKNPMVVGTYLNATSRGDIIIETDDGVVHVLKSGEAVRDVPTTFKVKGMNNNNYTCQYILPKGAHVEVNDMLISEKGNPYIVVAVNTEAVNNKGLFQGHRLIKEAI